MDKGIHVRGPVVSFSHSPSFRPAAILLDGPDMSHVNRRQFLHGSAALAISSPSNCRFLPQGLAIDPLPLAPKLDTGLYRFGVNYTPSHNWWFCWNDWDADPIRRDLDAIASLAADHLRLLLIWPYFQPNPKWISTLHLQRLDQLLAFMAERQLDALITVFTGQLSGWYFLPPFNRSGEAFFTDAGMWAAVPQFSAARSGDAGREGLCRGAGDGPDERRAVRDGAGAAGDEVRSLRNCEGGSERAAGAAGDDAGRAAGSADCAVRGAGASS